MRMNFRLLLVLLLASAVWCAEPLRALAAEAVTNTVPAVGAGTNAPGVGGTNALGAVATNVTAGLVALTNAPAAPETNAPAAVATSVETAASTNALTNAVVPAPAPASTNTGAAAGVFTNAPAGEPPPAPAVEFESSRSQKSSRRESSSSPPPSSSSPGNARIDFSTFKILGERNIFDPNRSSRSGRSNPPTSEAPPPPRYSAPSVVEAFSLVGTLAYADNQMAFIDGGTAQFKKALRLNDAVAGLKLKSVAASHATFDNDGAEIVLRVGHQLRREDRRAWQVNTQPAAYASAALASSTNSITSTNGAVTAVAPDGTATGTNAPAAVATAAAPAEPPPTPAMSEALRRLLEKRKKEEE